jgi:hypothetical protein
MDKSKVKETYNMCHIIKQLMTGHFVINNLVMFLSEEQIFYAVYSGRNKLM